MRTFSEYILESRQNYIFGGKDNRNTKIEAKKLYELIPGDICYEYNDNLYSTGDNVLCYQRIVPSQVTMKVKSTNSDTRYDYYGIFKNKTQHHIIFIRKADYELDSTLFEFPVGFRIVGTDLEEMIEYLKKKGKVFEVVE
jgi:hypothetical protein